jgi:hypothetical protein
LYYQLIWYHPREVTHMNMKLYGLMLLIFVIASGVLFEVGCLTYPSVEAKARAIAPALAPPAPKLTPEHLARWEAWREYQRRRGLEEKRREEQEKFWSKVETPAQGKARREALLRRHYAKMGWQFPEPTREVGLTGDDLKPVSPPLP